MRLEKLVIRNFRCFKNETEINIDENLTCLVGKNDIGKSTIMDALDIFFGNQKMDQDDASKQNTSNKVEITCLFSDLPESVVIDASAETDFASEFLLNNSGRLEILKIYNTTLKAVKNETFAIANHPSDESYNDLLYLKRPELKSRAQELGIDLKGSGIDGRINSHVRKAIWLSNENLEFNTTPIDLEREDAKRIWTQASNDLPVFALFKSDRKSDDSDAEVQDPLKTAVAEAVNELHDKLDEIKTAVRKKLEEIADLTVEKINEMDSGLAQTLKPTFSEPAWKNIFKVSITGDNQIPINKRGSGVRRLILLNFFRAKVELLLKSSERTNLIFAIEEPETSQHPDHQRMLLNALTEIADNPSFQVLITSHTPQLVRQLPSNSIRLIEEIDNERRVSSCDENTYKKVADALGILLDHNVKLFIEVEGNNDISFMKGICEVLGQDGLDIVDVSRLADKGNIIFLPLGGSNLIHWVSNVRLGELNIPEIMIVDRDTEPPEQGHYRNKVDEKNDQDDCFAYETKKREIENYIHIDAIKEAFEEQYNESIIFPAHFGDFEDIPSYLAKAQYESDGSNWEGLSEDKRKKKTNKIKRFLNNSAVKKMNEARLNEVDSDGEVIQWLEKIKELVER